MSVEREDFRRIFKATPYEISYFIGENPLGVVSKEHPTKEDHYLFLSYKEETFNVAERIVEEKKEEGLDKEWGELIWSKSDKRYEEMIKKLKLHFNKEVIVA